LLDSSHWAGKSEREVIIIKNLSKLLMVLIMLSLMIIQVAAFQTLDEYDRNIDKHSFSPGKQTSTFNPLSRQSSPKNVAGNQRTVGILVEFTDAKHSYSENEVNQLIFVNMRDYWEEVSYGNISITGETVGWYTLRNKMAHYGADSDHEIDDPDRDGQTDSWRLIRDAVNLVDEAVDFEEYDHIMIVHAGIGQESNPEASDSIWSVFFHDISVPTNDGVNVTSGIIVPEGELPGGIRSALGVFAHEFGHSLGLADLYMYTHRDVETLEDWSLMDHGEWLGSPPGSCPSHLESWGRIKLGWVTPLVVQPNGQVVSIYPLETKAGFPKAIKIPIADETYYLIEVRGKIGFDSCLPGEGVLITHVNEARKSGEGIIRVLDSNPWTIDLHDAAFQTGDMFEDNENQVYIRVYSRNESSYQIILSRKPIVLAKLRAPYEIFASYRDDIELLVFLADSEGKPLPHMIVLFEYGKDEKWTELGRSTTDGSGYAFLKTTLDLRPRNYTLRYVFVGGELGDLYYLSNSTFSTLTLAKKKVTLRYSAPTEITALDKIALRIYVLGVGKKPIPKVPIHMYLDGEIYEKAESNEHGFITVTLKFDLRDLGTHKIRVEVPENELYEKSTSESVITVHLPIWVWALVFVGTVCLTLIIIIVTKIKVSSSSNRGIIYPCIDLCRLNTLEI